MRSTSFVYILSLFFILVACDDTTSNDKTPPKILEVTSPMDGDTLFLTRNDNVFKAKFSDDEAISSYMVKIVSELNDYGREDSLYMKYSKGWSPIIYLAKEADAEHQIILGERQQHDSIKTRSLPIIPGDYKFKVYCMDMAGNTDSLIRDVKVVYPEVEVVEPKPEDPKESETE